MRSKTMIVDLNEVDWTAVGDSVCAIIMSVKADQKRFEEAAIVRKTNLEALVAAAITGMNRERLEKNARS
jgi:hypothetical protein